MVEFPIVLVMVIVILMSSSCGPKGPKGPKSWLKGLKIGSEGPPTKNPQRSPRLLVSDIPWYILFGIFIHSKVGSVGILEAP